jgi:hypothetical protein
MSRYETGLKTKITVNNTLDDMIFIKESEKWLYYDDESIILNPSKQILRYGRNI